jgi:thiosulfate dehydrogenase [quinone] large subunit
VYWQNGFALPAQLSSSSSITYYWYRTFLQTLLDNGSYSWFVWLITFGEMAVGIGLLLGCLTGVAAFFGAMMNMSFLLAGSASVNPVLFTLAVGLILG